MILNHTTGPLSLLLLASFGLSCLGTQDPAGKVPPPPKPNLEGVTNQGDGRAPGQADSDGVQIGDEADRATSQPVPVVGGTSNKGKPIPEGCWFKKIHLDFGEVVENTKETEVGDYGFENKTGKDQLITHFTTSCKCQNVKFIINGKEVKYKLKPTPMQPLEEPIKIPKDAKGKIVMTLDLSGASSERIAEIRVDTTDPEMPSFTLTSEAKILPAFTVEPEIFALGQMTPMQKKEFVFKVRSNIVKGPNWQITKKNPVLPGGLFVDSVEAKTDDKGYHYEIKGHYGPDLPQGAMGGDVIFNTNDARHNIMIRITAEVNYRVVITPRLAVMGPFSNKKSKEAIFYVVPNKVGDQVTLTGVDIYKSSHAKTDYDVKIVPPSTDEKKMLTLKGIKDPVPANAVWQLVITTRAGLKAKTFRIKGRLVFKEEGIAEKQIHIIGHPKGY